VLLPCSNVRHYLFQSLQVQILFCAATFYVCKGYNVAFEFSWVFIATFIECILLAEKLIPGHIQNWIYSDVIEFHKMAPTLHLGTRYVDISWLFSGP